MVRAACRKIEAWVWDDESDLMSLGKLTLIVCVVLAAIAVPLAYGLSALDANNPHIVLKKSEWHCSTVKTITHDVLIGKMLMPVTENVCSEWRMNGTD